MSELEITVVPATEDHLGWLSHSWIFSASLAGFKPKIGESGKPETISRDGIIHTKLTGYSFPEFYYDKKAFNLGVQEKILKLVKRGAAILVAVNPSDPNHFYGFLCYEVMNGKKIFHFAYTKSLFRNQGVMKSLLLSAGFDLNHAITCSKKYCFFSHYQDKSYKPVIDPTYDPPNE